MARSKSNFNFKTVKSENDPKSYRPISLLSVVYKLFERVLLTRILEQIEKSLPKEQADSEKFCQWLRM